MSATSLTPLEIANVKKYLALARVSSREQQREGFSLDVQEDALRRYAERMGGNHRQAVPHRGDTHQAR